MKGLFALVVLTLAAGTALGGKGRHRVRPNQQVWEQIVGNMERKKKPVPGNMEIVPVVAAVAATEHEAAAPKAAQQPVVAEEQEPVLKGLKKSRHGSSKVVGGPRFVQYSGRHPVGRHPAKHGRGAKLLQTRGAGKPPKKSLSAVAETRSSESVAKSIRTQIAEMKKERARKRQAAAAAAAAAEAEKKDVGRSWDKVWKPAPEGAEKPHRRVSLKDIEDAEDRKAQHKDDQADPDDPFAALNVDFKATQASEQKRQDKEEKAEQAKAADSAVAAQGALQAADADLKAKEAAVVAGAEGETLTKSWAFDVNQDPMGGVAQMEKDATSMLTSADKASVDEATAVGAKARAARQAIQDIAAKTQDADGLAASLDPTASSEPPPPPPKEETLDEALKKAKEAQKLENIDKVAMGVGKIWAKQTHDMALTSTLSSDLKTDDKISTSRVEKVLELEGEKAADQLGDLDQEWRQQFPGTGSSETLSTVYRHLGK